AGSYGASTAYVVDAAELAVFRSGPYTDAAMACIGAADPQVVLLPNSADGREIATRCAARLGVGVVNDVTVLEPGDARLRATRPCFGGSVLAEKECLRDPQIFTVRPNSFARLEAGGEATVVTLTVDFTPSGVLARVVDVVSERAGVLSLEEAAVIVTGGRGVGSPENFAVIEELAAVLGAAVGASRAVVDAGWKPSTYQVGQTGKTVSPALYIAVGLSGSIQHKAGMQTSDVIVAINKDPEAPIFNFATFGIVGDLHQIVPALKEEIRRRKAVA
ncbi:MAG: electron transfer flavoprotein subunit alpha/FixB family protein, partial [Thermoleophilia bacterium]|nr:electron transfer flavoprotein subunit alpha/FixB family protein [Thermoleophilia bacterium]